MNWLLAFLLAVAAFWLGTEGYAFLSFILLVVLVLFFIAGLSRSPEQIAAEEGNPGVYVTSQATDIPGNIDLKIKPTWEDNALFEDMFASWGEMLDTIGRSVKRAIFGKKKIVKGD